MDELQVLLDQVDELLGEGIVDGSDALEFAVVVGLASRLGASADALAEAEAWRKGTGAPLLTEIWAEVDPAEYVEALVGVIDGESPAEAVEEALWDFDELVAAAIWSRQTAKVRAAAAEVADLVRDVPEVFAPLRASGVEMARSMAVAEHIDLYGFWLAVADARDPTSG